jgi:tRNA pseudouridine38-40 synthase
VKNYKLIIQYDGTEYAGWQIQHNAVTVQQKVTEAIYTISKEMVTLNGSGRTDSGVHALGQTANFRCEQDLDLYKFKYQLNSILPSDISIIKAEETDINFHARFDANKRSYIYIISRIKTPFLDRYSWFINRNLDINNLNLISRELIGKKDFTGFCKSNTETKNKVCEVYSVHWKEIKGMVFFFIEADRFLHGMVRTILGTILKASDSSSPNELIQNVFLTRDRSEAGESVPASGLFLYKVKYGN